MYLRLWGILGVAIMSIKIVTGVLGAGKTFYVVRHMLYKFFTWSVDLHEWVPRVVGTKIFTNIAGCTVGGDLVREFAAAGGFFKFFTIDYQRKFIGDSGAVYIVDEAQMLFDERFYNKDVFSFFQWSRHMGIDIYLVTQDVSMLPRGLRNICEFEVRSVRRSYSYGMGFRYNLCSPYSSEIFQRISCRKDARVFAVYRSMERGEGEKVKSMAVRQLVFAVSCLVVVIVAFVFWFTPYFLKSGKGSGVSSVSSGRPSVVGGNNMLPSSGVSGASVSLAGVNARLTGPLAHALSGGGHGSKFDGGGAVRGVVGGESLWGVGVVSPVRRSGKVASSEGEVREKGEKFPRWVVTGVARVSGEGEGLFSVEESDGGSWVGTSEEVERVFRAPADSAVVHRWGPVWEFVASADELAMVRGSLKGARGAGAESAPPTGSSKPPAGGALAPGGSTISPAPGGGEDLSVLGRLRGGRVPGGRGGAPD